MPAIPDSLRDLLQRHAKPARPQTNAIRFGIPVIDNHLPPGGLAQGALHECAGAGPDTEHATAATRLIAALLAGTEGTILWILRHHDLFAPGLASAGLHPDRLIMIETGNAAALLATMEEALRQPGLAAVVGELDARLTLTASRRLHLAAEASGTTGFLLRRSRVFDDPALSQPSAAITRWRVTAIPSPQDATVGLARPRLRLELRHCRGAEPAQWIVETDDATGRLAVPADLAHGLLATGEIAAARRA